MSTAVGGAAHYSPGAGVTATASKHTAQNWIVGPLQDALLIIGTPILVLAAALFAFATLDPLAATSLIVTVHIVFTVAHHLPTFVRIYGDVDLLRRYRWPLLLGPVVPLVFSAFVLAYLNAHDYPLDYFLYVYLFLALWDPWHFLRQHYGFMRLYDRPNAAPRALAGRMDWWLCASWFVYIMLASGSWLAGFLEDLQTSVHFPALAWVHLEWISAATTLMRDVAVLTTIAYVGYILWCRSKGYFISTAKLLLFAITFGALYFAYTPNAAVLHLVPEWSFKVGFAAIGIVHVTQYFAVVWRYNRGLAAHTGRARQGWFERVHRRGGAWLVLAYVVAGWLYGEAITTPRANHWLMSVLLAVGFTSTLLHYYFDGFIWKVRHQENHEGLGFTRTDSRAPTVSWWSKAQRIAAAPTLARQFVYFAVPLAVLTTGALAAWSSPATSSMAHMLRAHKAGEQGNMYVAAAAATEAHAAMTAELPVARKLYEIEHSSSRAAALAYLTYNESHYRFVVLPALAGKHPDPTQVSAHRTNVSQAIELLDEALARGQLLGHQGREQMTQDDAERALATWRRILITT